MNKSNKNITFKGSKLTLLGSEIKEGQKAPGFTVVGTDMSDLTLERFKGKTVVFSTVPSLDTPVCSIETKRFNAEAQDLSPDIAVLTVSLDLPFAQQRWCGAEGVENVTVASDYKYRQVGEAFGVYIKEMGLLARAIFVIGKDSTVRYVEYVPAISDEPQYGAALEAARSA